MAPETLADARMALEELAAFNEAGATMAPETHFDFPFFALALAAFNEAGATMAPETLPGYVGRSAAEALQ